MESEGKRGDGAFQWNRAGWFGGQIGATLWLVLLGALLLARSQPVGVLLVGLGVFPNLVGLVLWRKRNSLPPYLALQVLIAVCGASAAVAMFLVHRHGVSFPSSDLPSAWFLFLYPGLMVTFYLQERSARKHAALNRD